MGVGFSTIGKGVKQLQQEREGVRVKPTPMRPEQLEIRELKKRNERRYSIKLLCEVFGVHRSSYKYWRKRDKGMTPETAKLHSQVKEVHRQSNGSAGARAVVMMATNNVSVR